MDPAVVGSGSFQLKLTARMEVVLRIRLPAVTLKATPLVLGHDMRNAIETLSETYPESLPIQCDQRAASALRGRVMFDCVTTLLEQVEKCAEELKCA